MTQDYEPGDDVIWTNPTSCRDFEATIIEEAISQGESVSTRERQFKIRVKEPGKPDKTMTVPISQLSRPNHAEGL